MKMPQAELIKLRDKRAATPGSADNFVKSVRAMYAWALERNIVSANPAVGISKINRDGTGAKPWTLDDLTAYRERHKFGTMAHLALTLFMFTACRIGDAVLLGRGHELRRGNTIWLDMQPSKRGSSRVRIPMLPPLYKATRAVTVVGPTYLLNEHGKPFASKNAFGNKFRQWCEEAGLKGLSSHGIRKAAGELLALQGASQYHIMAVHGHSSAKTSEVYTKGVRLANLVDEADQQFRRHIVLVSVQQLVGKPASVLPGDALVHAAHNQKAPVVKPPSTLALPSSVVRRGSELACCWRSRQSACAIGSRPARHRCAGCPHLLPQRLGC